MKHIMRIRRWLIASLVGALAVAMTTLAAPASAAVTVSWSIEEAAGTITFTNSHSYTIRTTIYNPYMWGTVGSMSQGEYGAGNGRYICGSSPTHTNTAYDTVRTWTDNTNCSYANIESVKIVEFHTRNVSDEIYVDNPLA